MRTTSLVRFLFFSCSLFFLLPTMMTAQCPSTATWTIRDDCGPILANGGIAPNSPPIFCEGQIVTFLNTTDPNAGVTKVYMDWGDGTCQSFDGNPPFFTHAYDIPDDSCVSVATATYFLYMGVEKKCGVDKSSFHYIITPLAVSFKPVSDPIAPLLVCQNEPAIFLNQCHTASNVTSVWSSSDGTTLNGGTFLHGFSTPGNNSVTLTVSNLCGSDATTIPVLVTPTAVAKATLSDTALCLPNATVLVNNQSLNSIGQFWSITPDQGYIYLNGTGPGSLNPQIQFQAPGDYTLQMVVVGCGSPTWKQVIHVTSPPTIAKDTIANSCSNFTLDANNYFTPGGGLAALAKWTFSGATPAAFLGADAPPTTFSGVGLHVISLDLFNHCGSASLSDSFYILPAAIASIMLSDTVLCIPDDKLTITNNSTNAQGYLWWITPVPWGSFLNGTGALSAEPVLDFSTEGYYTIHLQVSGCGSPQWTGKVRVRRKPDATLILPIEDACFSAVVTPSNHITFSGGQPDYINWNFAGGSPGTFSGAIPPQVNYSMPGSFVVQAIIGNVCGADTVADGFTIFNPTVVTATTPIDSICRSASAIQLQAIPSGGYWSGPGVSSGGVFDPAVGLNNAWSQLVYNYGPPDCRIYDTVHIYVMSVDVDAGAPVVRCVNSGVLTLSGQTPASGIWSGPGVSYNGIFDPAFAGVGAHTLMYTVVDANGCPNPDPRSVVVNAAPDATLASLPESCVGTSIDFGALSGGSGGTSCDWDFGDGSTSINCSPTHTYYVPGNYLVKLILTNADACRDTASNPLIMHDLPDADFALDQLQGCGDLVVNITNTSVSNAAANYNWKYGDGQMDTISQPGQHIYAQATSDTTYLLELTATNQCGLSFYTQGITVYPQPQVHFASDVATGCSPLIVHFNNISVGNPTSYRWYINDVLVDSSAQLSTQTFYADASDSLYRVVLIGENACGFDTLRRDIIVHPNTVVAFAHINPTIGCVPFTLHAYNYSTDGMFANWTFGDGNSGIGDSIQHTYTLPGLYQVYLYVNNGCGHDTISKFITVLPAPDLSFACPPYVCYGDSVSFINTSTGLSGCYWQFGDGGPTLTDDSPNYMYAAPGQYFVTMVGFAVNTGCEGVISQPITVHNVPVVSAKLDISNGCEPFTVKPTNLSTGADYYLWKFGDGATSVEHTPTHIYNDDGQYPLYLKVTDGYGCSSDTTMFPVTVYPKPEPAFTLHQSPLCKTPVTLTFHNNTTHADAYQWAFGNGLHSDAIDPTFDMSSGPLDVHLAGFNQFGCTAVVDTQVNVYSQPMVDIHLDQQIGCAPFTVLFENVSDGVNHFEWSFGNGESSTFPNPIHRFDTPGTYNVHLVGNNDGICYDSSDIKITVLPIPQAAFTSAALSDTTVESNGIFLFNDASVNAVDWIWDFGDGGTSTLQNPIHRYLINGDKPVTLIVSNQYGCRDTISQLIKPEPFGNLFIPNTFSPEIGADGAREFRPVGIGLQQFKVEVFATNGQRVWGSDELVDGHPVAAWDGTFQGDFCPPGVYWWKCSAVLAGSRPWTGMSFDGKQDPMREGKLLLIR